MPAAPGYGQAVARLRRTSGLDLARMNRAVAELAIPEAVWKTCPWQPRALVETGLRQWLRCAGAALRDNQVIGMPSHAVDEAWHGLILCTSIYATFCEAAYGQFLHHHPDGGAPAPVAARSGAAELQLNRTVIAWSLVAEPDQQCVLWDLDAHLDGLEDRWGLAADKVDAVLRAAAQN
jgi:hypothetical protein